MSRKIRNIIIAVAFGICIITEYMWSTPLVVKDVVHNEDDEKVSIDNKNVKVIGKPIEKKMVYITFDDGPSCITQEVAEILEKNEVNATFFIVGSKLTESTEQIVRKLYSSGNQFGVHTYSHDASFIYCSADNYYDDVMKTEERLIRVLGISPTIYRFPWGSNNCYIRSYRSKIIKRFRNKGLEYCDWNVSGEDSVGCISASSIYANVKKNYKQFNEPVLLLHDSATNSETVKALPDIISLYKDAGYSFGTIRERTSKMQWKKVLD